MIEPNRTQLSKKQEIITEDHRSDVRTLQTYQQKLTGIQNKKMLIKNLRNQREMEDRSIEKQKQ